MTLSPLSFCVGSLEPHLCERRGVKCSVITGNDVLRSETQPKQGNYMINVCMSNTDLESAGSLRQAYDGQLTEISAQKAHWDLHRSLLSETLSLGNNLVTTWIRVQLRVCVCVCMCMFTFPSKKINNNIYKRWGGDRFCLCVCVIRFFNIKIYRI